jgi:hypothetical protein
MIKSVDHTVRQATFRRFPILCNQTMAALSGFAGGRLDPVDPDDEVVLHMPSELFKVLDAEINELEQRLDNAAAALQQRQDHRGD